MLVHLRTPCRLRAAQQMGTAASCAATQVLEPHLRRFAGGLPRQESCNSASRAIVVSLLFWIPRRRANACGITRARAAVSRGSCRLSRRHASAMPRQWEEALSAIGQQEFWSSDSDTEDEEQSNPSTPASSLHDDLPALRRAVSSIMKDPRLLDCRELAFMREAVEALAPEPQAAKLPREPASAEPPPVSIYYPPEMRGAGSGGPPLPDGLKVFIATPAYGGNVTVDYMTSVINLVTSLKEVAWQLHLTAGESIITVGRNNAVMEFLASDCTHLLFLDADVAFNTATVRGLLALDEDVVLAPYPAKNLNEAKMQDAALRQPGRVPRLRDGLHFVLHATPDKLQEALDAGRNIVEIEAGPTGCMLIKRHVFDRLREAYPDMHCRLCGTHAGRTMRYDVWWRFFDTMVAEDGEFLGEDIAFCKRWRAIGGRVYADLGATMSHVGRHAFTGSMLDGVAGG